jgi:hypothetical protein
VLVNAAAVIFGARHVVAVAVVGRDLAAEALVLHRAMQNFVVTPLRVVEFNSNREIRHRHLRIRDSQNKYVPGVRSYLIFGAYFPLKRINVQKH